jgi:hypothetical protein
MLSICLQRHSITLENMVKVRVKFILEYAMKAHTGSRGIDSSTVSLILVLDGGAYLMPRPSLFTPGKRPGTHCMEG